MVWLMLLRRPLGRLISFAFTAGLAGVLYLTVGKGMIDDVKNVTARQDGGGPQEERIVNKRNFGPMVKALRKEVGREAQLLTVTMRPASVEFVVRDGAGAKGYRAEPGSNELDDAEVNLSGSGTVEENAWSIGKLDSAAPGRIAKAVSGKESGDLHLTIATLERESNGKLLWDMKGTIAGRGVSYTARPDGSKVKSFDPTSLESSGVPKGVGSIGECIRKAGTDANAIQECTKGLGGGG